MKDHLPVYKKDSFVCPHCKLYAGHKFQDLYLLDENRLSAFEQCPYVPLVSEICTSSNENLESQSDVSKTQSEDTVWHISTCYTCKKVSFWEGVKLVYPMPADAGFPEPSAEMPEGVLELYKEASAVFPVSKRASAALMRAATEKLVYELTKDNLSRNVNLDGRIKFLSQSVSQDVFKALTIIRTIGNKVLHSKDEEAESVTFFLGENIQGLPQALANSLNALVNQFIVNRRLIGEVYEILPDSVLGQLEGIIERYNQDGMDNN